MFHVLSDAEVELMVCFVQPHGINNWEGTIVPSSHRGGRVVDVQTI